MLAELVTNKVVGSVYAPASIKTLYPVIGDPPSDAGIVHEIVIEVAIGVTDVLRYKLSGTDGVDPAMIFAS